MSREFRSPTAVSASVRALVHVGRGAEAFELAKENAAEFPDSPDAAHIVVQAAHGIDRDDQYLLLGEFSERFPDDSRSWRTVTLEEVKRLINKPAPVAELWKRHADGSFPLHLIDARVTLAYERALGSSGLVTWRPAIPLATPDQFDREIMLDITAVLSIDHMGLWAALGRSGLRFCIHPSVVEGLRAERDSLAFEAQSGLAKAAEEGQRLLALLDREETAADTDEEEAQRIGGVVVASWSEGERHMLNLVGAASGRIGRSKAVQIERALHDHYEGSKLDDRTDYVGAIVLSDLDAKAICHSGRVDDVLACFEYVSISRTGKFGLRRFFDHARSEREAFLRASVAYDSLERALSNETIRMLAVDEEPVLTSFRYFTEVGRIAEDERFCIWVDDLALRRVLGTNVPNVPTCSTWDVVAELRNREILRQPEFDEICAEAARGGFLSVPRIDAFNLLIASPYGLVEALRLAWRVSSRLNFRSDDPPTALGHDLMLAAAQLTFLIRSGISEWRQVVEVFLNSAPEQSSPLLWETVFVSLAGNDKDYWPIVKEIAFAASRRNRFDLRSSLLWLHERGLHEFPPAFLPYEPTTTSVQFEGRWRLIRLWMRRRNIAR